MGTDRVYQASLQLEADLYVNVQGDEPLVKPADILAVIEAARARPGRRDQRHAPSERNTIFVARQYPKW